MTCLAISTHRKLYKFTSDTDVEVISRVLRVWDEDMIPSPAALDLGEVIIKVGGWHGLLVH